MTEEETVNSLKLEAEVIAEAAKQFTVSATLLQYAIVVVLGKREKARLAQLAALIFKCYR